MVAAAKLRTPIAIQSPLEGYDELGQPIDAWDTFYSCFADLRHLSGLETIKAGASTSIVQASILMRYRSGITAGMRVIGPHGAYNVTAVLDNKHNGETTLLAERVQ